MRNEENASRRPRTFVGRLIVGVLSGVIATVAMERVVDLIAKQTPNKVLKTESKLTGGVTPFEVGAERIAGVVGRSLSGGQRHTLGLVLEQVAGGVLGAAVGGIFRRPNVFRSLLVGTALFGIVEEIVPYLLGISANPRRFPWQAHARHFAAGITYGVAADATRRLLTLPMNAFMRRPDLALA